MIRMMYKYELKLGQVNEIQIPQYATPRAVGLQTNKAQMWVEVPVLDPTMIRRFRVFATGQEIPVNAIYVGTYQDGALVWHVFEVPE